jgi:hypothetical protein
VGNNMSLKAAAELCAQEFTVNYEGGGIETIWIRTRTQAEIEEEERQMADARLAIKEKYRVGTTAYQSLVIDMDMESDRSLAALIAGAEELEISRRAIRDLPSLIPFDPSKYHSESDRARAEEEFDKRRAERDDCYRQKVNELTSKREEELLTLAHEKLVELAAGPVIRNLVRIETEILAQSYIIKDCVRDGEEHARPYFDSVEEIPPPGAVRDSMLAAIEAVDQIRPVEIKNSQGRSVMQIGPADDTRERTGDSLTNDSPGRGSRKKSSRGGRKR